MELYAGCDLHSTNNVLNVMNDTGRTVEERRLKNDLELILKVLEPYRRQIQGIVVESTFNWYWLVDSLMDAGYKVHLANTAGIQQYSGLKHSDDRTDAWWLAEMLRLGILPEGYIYPKETRPVRDLLRKRSQLVRQRTMQVLSIQNLVHRNTGQRMKSDAILNTKTDWVSNLLPDPNLALSVQSSLAVAHAIDMQIKRLEKVVHEQSKPDQTYKKLLTIAGIGKILAQTIWLEVGDIGRFKSPGNYASYCRLVQSEWTSNGKKKGKGNRKNGNQYLSWAYAEAAVFAIRYYPGINRYYQRKMSRTNVGVAIKAVAHKLARASYFVMRDGVSFEEARAFS
jgi:transposase